MFQIWQLIECIKDYKTNPDIPEIQINEVYTIVNITHWRPQIQIQNSDWQYELVYYNPNRFVLYKTKEQREKENIERIEEIEKSISDAEYKMIKQNMYRYNKSLKKG